MSVKQIPNAVYCDYGLPESDMRQIRCFVTRNILEWKASEYHLSFVLKRDSCVIIAMGNGQADMSDFFWIGWDKLRLMLPDPHQILLIGNVGRWDRPRGSFRWMRSI
jgi:hypothetical protein